MSDTEQAAAAVAVLLLLTKGKSRVKNTSTFKGQIWTKSAAFDAELEAISKRVGVPFNWLFFNIMRESGAKPQAHVNHNKANKSGFDFGLFDTASIGKNTWGGGLFGLVRPYAAPYIGSMSFEDWLRSDEMNQLKGFELWVSPFAKYIKEPADIRLAGFAPAFLKSPDSATVYKDPSKSYTAHAYLDVNDDGKLSKGELKEIWRKQYEASEAKAAKKGKATQV